MTEVERMVNASGNVSLGDHIISAGMPLAGQRVTLRLDGPVAHILSGGILARTVACPVPEQARARLRGGRAGTAQPPRLPEPLTVTRRVSVRGAIMIGAQRIQVGLAHARKIAQVTVESDTYQITVEPGITVTAPHHRPGDQAAQSLPLPAAGQVMAALPAMLDPVTGRDMHEDLAPQVPREHRLPAGARVSVTVLCHHPWGVGIRLADGTQDGHVDVPFIRDGPVRGPQDYPPVGQAMPAVVIRYSGTGQLRLSMRPSDITGNS